MDRQRVLWAAMKPMDVALGVAVNALEASGRKEKLTDSLYRAAQAVLRDLLERGLALRVEGAERVPKTGGVLLAANHQSWLDAELLGAACPRRVRFVAKESYRTWPVLRHLIALSDSSYLREGGDPAGMSGIIQALRSGRVVALFPEGTIPGEGERARHEVEPDTGLLRGHTTAVRMAIAARVPIVPVGISGSGRVLPPEVYPRLDLLEVHRAPVVVRFGKPIHFAELWERDATLPELRDRIHQVMEAISALVEHDKGFVPLRVPMEPPPAYERVGVLLLHGLASDQRAFDGLKPLLERAQIPFAAPRLWPQGARLDGLRGLAKDWYDEAERALVALHRELDRVVVVGFSLGGLLAVNLGIEHPEKVAGVAALAVPLKLRGPRGPAVQVLAHLLRSLPSPARMAEPAPEHEPAPRLDSNALLSVIEYARQTVPRLGELKVPVCVIQSRADALVDPASAVRLYRDVGSSYREIHWFEKSGHELGQDLEKDEVFRKVMAFVERFRARPEAQAAP